MQRPALKSPTSADVWFRDWPTFSASLTFSSLRRAQGAETSNQRVPRRSKHRLVPDARTPRKMGHRAIDEAARYIRASDKLAAASSPMLTLQWVANYFSVEERTIHRWIRNGLIRSKRIGRLHRFHMADIERMAQAPVSESSDDDLLDAHISSIVKAAPVKP